jgi:hypothetical protein
MASRKPQRKAAQRLEVHKVLASSATRLWSPRLGSPHLAPVAAVARKEHSAARETANSDLSIGGAEASTKTSDLGISWLTGQTRVLVTRLFQALRLGLSKSR